MNDLEQAGRELFTIRDFIRWGASRFNENRLHYGHGTDNAWDEAVQLVLHALHLPEETGPEVLDARLTSEERKLLLVVISTRILDRIPAAYINGKCRFAGLEFKVDERALIPRSPLAELIEQGFEPWVHSADIVNALDLCTGGGCIGIAIAHHLPHCRVDLADLSEEALDLARINTERHEMQQRVSLYQSDLFSNLPAGSCYELIISNPPYVDAEDFASMPAEYAHEPALGLEAGHDGLDIVRRILAQAANYLSEQGVLIVELGNSADALCEAYPDAPFTWLDFERGGHGVFLISRQDLAALA